MTLATTFLDTPQVQDTGCLPVRIWEITATKRVGDGCRDVFRNTIYEQVTSRNIGSPITQHLMLHHATFPGC
jgi:hypothetical protein